MYRQDTELQKIGEALISKEDSIYHIEELGYTVAYFYSQQEKKQGGNMVLGECMKVDGILSYYCKEDFIIIIYEPNIENLGFGKKELKILLFHELMHIGTDGKLRGHDIEEFAEILDTYGIGWQIPKS